MSRSILEGRGGLADAWCLPGTEFEMPNQYRQFRALGNESPAAVAQYGMVPMPRFLFGGAHPTRGRKRTDKHHKRKRKRKKKKEKEEGKKKKKGKEKKRARAHSPAGAANRIAACLLPSFLPSLPPSVQWLSLPSHHPSVHGM